MAFSETSLIYQIPVKAQYLEHRIVPSGEVESEIRRTQPCRSLSDRKRHGTTSDVLARDLRSVSTASRLTTFCSAYVGKSGFLVCELIKH